MMTDEALMSQKKVPRDEEWNANHEKSGGEGRLSDSAVTELEKVRAWQTGQRPAFASHT
jgi:hypothetical protein